MRAGNLVKVVDPSDIMHGLDIIVSKTRSFGNIGKSS